VDAIENPQAATPSTMYGPGARALQAELDTRRLADVLARHTLHGELTDDDVALIEAQSTVWISTVDAEGWPDVSYKGGDVGFVAVASRTELRIPSYDGNGMMRTLGNIADTGRVALLFVDTSRPWRMRIHGTARVSLDADDLARHHGADAVIVVTIGRVFPNCGRYIHTGGVISEYVPHEGAPAPIPEWKRYDLLRPALPARDQERLAAEEA
jgi:predicted pyridoxine 5'-phosphate oxidase superfamily flavin-nucleotide-binding protein